MSTNPARLGELTAYDLGSTITFRDGGATYTGSLLSVKHEFPDGKRRTFLMLVSASGKWRHADRYPSNLPIDEVARPARATGGQVPSTGGSAGGSAGGAVVVDSIQVHHHGAALGISPVELLRRQSLGRMIEDGRRA